MESITFYAKTLDDLEQQLISALKTLPNPSLAFVFTSIDSPIEEIQKLFSKHDIKIFGISTGDQIYETQILQDTISVLLTNIPKDYFKIYIEKQQNPEDYYTLGKTLGQKAKQTFKYTDLIVALSGRQFIDGDSFIDGLIEQVGLNSKIFGGVAADNLSFSHTFIFNNEQIYYQGGLALVLDSEKILVDGISYCGWEGLGEKKLITKSEKNRVYEIDGQPAITSYIKYYGLPMDVKETKDILDKFGSKFPLIVYKDEKPPVMRIPIFADPDTLTLDFAGLMPQNAKVRFTVPPTFEVIDNTIKHFRKINLRFPEADFLLMFSCKARYMVFSIMIEDEIMEAKNLWDKPMAGFFTYGEFGPTEDGFPAFHNETATLILFKEIK